MKQPEEVQSQSRQSCAGLQTQFLTLSCQVEDVPLDDDSDSIEGRSCIATT